MELALFSLTALVAAVPFVWRLGAGQRWAWAGALSLLAVAAFGPLLWRPPVDELAPSLPGAVEDQGFVTSATCRKCHPQPYHSWHISHHRRMTEPGRLANVLAEFDGVELRNRGRVTKFSRRGEEMWVDMVDPAWELEHRSTPLDEMPANPPRVQRQVVMTTGSHHMQAYWVRGEDEQGLYFQVPWVYYRPEDRWIPSQDSFLQPPSARPAGIEVWNFVCTRCHTVGSDPGLHPEESTFDSATGELGIACEACHGPGEAHVAKQQAPLTRYLQHLAGDDAGDPSIVNPARLDSKRGAQVCGQCHAFFTERDERSYLVSGSSYRPGDDLHASRLVVQYTEEPTGALLAGLIEREPDALSARFWADGTIRTTGREYNAMLETGCFQKGEMSCTTCHSMHDYRDRNDQLAKIDGDQTCLQCHEQFGTDVSAHTHHAAGSAGSRCYNCHMPHTTYGLFSAIRSHRVDSPSAKVSVDTGRPNACNQCHVDKTLAWTAEHLSDWYAQPPVEMGEDETNLSASLLWLLRGDAAQRAIAAWTFGWDEAQRASGDGWQAPFLAQLLRDPYAAVRRVAFASLQSLPGYENFRFDFVAPSPELVRASQTAFEIWRQQPVGTRDRTGPAVMIAPDGQLQREAAVRLMRQRDDRPIRIIE